MEIRKRPINGLIQDALASMDIDPDSQKPVNIRTSSEQRFKDKLVNAQKSSGFYLEDYHDDEEKNKEGLLNNKISAVPIGSVEGCEKYILWFSEISNKDIKYAGGKGASLGEMFNNKFPVPPGFVITAQAFDYFMTKKGLKEKIYDIISGIDFEDTEELTDASKKIRKMIESEEMPADLRKEILEAYNILSSEDIEEFGISSDALNILKNSQELIFVSVRSSATTEDLADASFAGQQESFLNVKGKDSLIEYVKKCFSSLYTPRAIYYRNKKGFKEGEALLAVVVQKMVDSEKSGVVFSRDPVNMDDNVAIEAVFGLGEGIVSGRIKPDHYIVSRDLKLQDVQIANKKVAIVRTGSGENEIVKLSSEKSKSQVLKNSEILEIANYSIKLEKHYKKPQDIEFAIEGGEVYIVQSRPITTLGKKTQERELSGKVILQGQSASPGIGVGTVKIINSMADLPKIKKGDILVTEMTNPDMVVAMQKSSAIVTDEGGMTSHAAIVSREMGIPCIVGTETATKVLKDGMKITVDGSSGKVYEGEIAESHSAEIRQVVPTQTIKIKVIVDLPDFAERAAETGIDTVGLTRLEGIIATMKKHPLLYEKENNLHEYSKIIEQGLEKILSYFKKVWFRASDIRTDEYSSLEGAPEKEINPMLGFHGIRFSLKHPKILKAELEAMKKVAKKAPDKKIGIMFPQVISIEEVKEAKEYFKEFKLPNMEFGVMIETPSAVQIINEICKYVDFVSFGTNDLTQFTLAIDRNNEDVQYLYNELHPAIFSQIEKVIDACNKAGVETSICGQAGSKKEMAEFLFKKGISSISVNADAAYEISNLIREIEENHKREEEAVKEEIKKVEQGKESIKKAEIEIAKKIEKIEDGIDKRVEEKKDNESISSSQRTRDSKIEARESSHDVQKLGNTKSNNNSEKNNRDVNSAVDNKNKEKDYKNSKKYQRYLRWRERKKEWKTKKIEERINGGNSVNSDDENNERKEKLTNSETDWGKKAELGFNNEISDNVNNENNERRDLENMSPRTSKKKNIEKIDNLDRIKIEAEEITEGIAEEKEGELAEESTIEDNIKTSMLSSNEIIKEHQREKEKEEIKEFEKEYEQEKEIEKYDKEGKIVFDRDALEIDDEKEHSNDENPEMDSKEAEEINAYKFEDNNGKALKKKYSYDFKDFE